jgi:hypothetical protein
MDLTKLTYGQLWDLYHQIGWEMTKRSWWVILLLVVGYIGFRLYFERWRK